MTIHACPSCNPPPSRRYFLAARTMLSSMPAHASSRSTSGGLVTSARINNTTDCSPGERSTNDLAAKASTEVLFLVPAHAVGPIPSRTCHILPTRRFSVSPSSSNSAPSSVKPTRFLPLGTNPPSKAVPMASHTVMPCRLGNELCNSGETRPMRACR